MIIDFLRLIPLSQVFRQVGEGGTSVAITSFPWLAFTFTSPGEGFNLGPISLRWYGLLIAMGLIAGLALAQQIAKIRRFNPDTIGDLTFWLVVGAIPMARLYYVAFEWNRQVLVNGTTCSYATCPLEIIKIWHGGIAIHGAILGGIIAAIVFSRIRRLSFWQMADIVAPGVSLGQAIGRWGNFFNSEAFGAPTTLPWKVLIPLNNRPEGLVNEAYYHPTFLYESLWNLGVCAGLFWLSARYPKLKRGTIFLLYAIAYSLGRVWIEALRLDSLMVGPLKMAQVVSLGAIAIALLGLVWLYGLKRNLPDVRPVQIEK